MSNKLKRALASWGKFVLWVAVAAVLKQIISQIGNFHIPEIWVPIIASVLKSWATYAATEEEQTAGGLN